MSLLNAIATNRTIVHPSIPLRPAGRYVHFILLRETESFPLFQTMVV